MEERCWQSEYEDMVAASAAADLSNASPIRHWVK